METRHQSIKPLLSYSLCLQNVSKYNRFLIKRPKTPFNFKFSTRFHPFISSHEHDKKIQNKLHKALKLLKSVRKVDLSVFGVRDSSISQARLLLILKKLSKAEIISMKSMIDPHQLSDDFLENWLRYFPRIRHLDWGLVISGTQSDVKNFVSRQKYFRNPLKYLHYCPKIKSLKIDSDQTSNEFLQKALQIKRYPPSLRHLDTKAKLNKKQLNLSQRNLPKLKSIGFIFDPAVQSVNSTISMINSLSKMTDLREIDLHFMGSMAPEIEAVFTKLPQGRKLGKVKLDFPFEMPDIPSFFQELKSCPVTHFSINTPYTNNTRVLESISNFLREMILLESLEIFLKVQAPLKDTNPLKLLCKQIAKLEYLHHLQLCFASINQQNKSPILELDDIPLRHLELETLSLFSSQFASSKPLYQVITQLQNSYESLQKLTLFLENHCPDEQINGEIVNSIKKLVNIQALSLPYFEISSINLLNRIVETVKSLKCLRSLQLGMISNKIPPAGFARALEMLLRKKGLESFSCRVDQSYLQQMQEKFAIDMNKIMRINPSLEHVNLFRQFQELYSW